MSEPADRLDLDAIEQRAWLLTETWRDGSIHYEGIALTNDAASAWVASPVRINGRTSLPYPIIGDNPLAAERARLQRLREMIEAWQLGTTVNTNTKRERAEVETIQRTLNAVLAALLAETAKERR